MVPPWHSVCLLKTSWLAFTEVTDIDRCCGFPYVASPNILIWYLSVTRHVKSIVYWYHYSIDLFLVIVLWQDCTVDLGCGESQAPKAPNLMMEHRTCSSTYVTRKKKNIHLPFTSQFSKLHQNWYWFNAHQDTHTCDFIWNESENVLVQWIVGSAWMNTNSRGMIHQSMNTAEMQMSFFRDVASHS